LSQRPPSAPAAARGDLAEVRELLEAGADPNGTNSFGRTPLQVGSPGAARGDELLPAAGGEPQPARPAHRCLTAHGRGPRRLLDTLRRGTAPGGARTPDGRGRLPIDVGGGGSRATPRRGTRA
uniref:CDN2B inhibitor n=1 Tax=Anas platyrhynchos TaxID=8839 RepID=A0A8B9ZF44_ANAPL